MTRRDHRAQSGNQTRAGVPWDVCVEAVPEVYAFLDTLSTDQQEGFALWLSTCLSQPEKMTHTELHVAFAMFVAEQD